jgi:hypothetical protein
MIQTKRLLSNLLLGIVTCLLLISLSTPIFSQTLSDLVVRSSANSTASGLIHDHVVSSLRDAESVLVTQANMSNADVKSYVAVLTKGNVVPTTPSGFAFGAAGAALMGDRLVVRGDFSNLTSSLRDYSTDPVNPPNPNITSGVHIHQGEPTINGPFQYALEVMLDQTGKGGRFAGEYTLTSEQMQALADGMLYMDIHTTQNRGGELRGILMPY